MMNITIYSQNECFAKKGLSYCVFSALESVNEEATFSYIYELNNLYNEVRDYKGVLIVDTYMLNFNSVAVARKLRSINEQCNIIFIVCGLREAFSLTSLRLADVIVRSSEKEEYIEILTNVFDTYKKAASNLVFEIVEGGNICTKIISPSDIYFLECVCRQIYLHTAKDKYLLHQNNFSRLVVILKPYGFVETCRGYAVNISKIRDVVHDKIELISGSIVPLSRDKKQQVRESLEEKE